MVTFRPVTVQPSRAIRPTTSTSIARSSTLMRSCSDVLVVAVEHGDRPLGDDRPGVDAGVDHEQGGAGDLDAVGQRVPRPVHAGERRQQRRVGVDEPAAEAVEERRPDQPHEAGRHHQVGRQRRHPVGQRDVPGGPVGVLGRRADERVDRRGRGPGRAHRRRRGRHPPRRPSRRTPGRPPRRAAPAGWSRCRRPARPPAVPARSARGPTLAAAQHEQRGGHHGGHLEPGERPRPATRWDRSRPAGRARPARTRAGRARRPLPRAGRRRPRRPRRPGASPSAATAPDRRQSRPATTPAATGTSSTTGAQAGPGSCGSAASSGKAGTAPRSVPPTDTVVPAPTANPGPTTNARPHTAAVGR